MQWLCVAGNNVQEIPAQIVSGRLWLVPSGDKAKRQGLPLSKICPSFTQRLFPFCPPSDYCLTTIFPKLEKSWKPRRAKGSHGFCKWVLILCNVPETRMKPGFLPWRPDNDHSVGSWSPAGTVQDRPSRQVRTLVRIQSGAPDLWSAIRDRRSFLILKFCAHTCGGCLFYVNSKNHSTFSCSFYSFGKNSFSLYFPHFSVVVSHLLPKSTLYGNAIPLTIACAENSFEL